MKSENSSAKIEMFNYYFWKIRIQHVRTRKYLENYLDEEPPSLSEVDIEALLDWTKNGKKVQGIVDLSISNGLLENVRAVPSTKEIWTAIKNIFEHYTLLNKISTRKKFYTATMTSSEFDLQFSNRVRKLAATLKFIDVQRTSSDMAIILLNSLPDDYDSLINAVDDVDEDETK